MKKIIITIVLLTCIFISGCNIQENGKVKSLEDAYFYLLDKSGNEESLKIEDVKKLLKDYKLDILDHSENHDVNDEKSYEYIFNGKDKTYLSVNFIVSSNKETIDSLQYNLDNDTLNLVANKVDKQWEYIIYYNDIDKSIYKKIMGEINNLNLSIQKKENQYSLESACDYIMDKMASGKNIKIEDIKKLLKNYDFKSELIEDDPTRGLKIYDYTFKNDDKESVKITTYVENNKETISGIRHSIGKISDNSNLVLSFEQKCDVSVRYHTSNKTIYKKAYSIINKIK